MENFIFCAVFTLVLHISKVQILTRLSNTGGSWTGATSKMELLSQNAPSWMLQQS